MTDKRDLNDITHPIARGKRLRALREALRLSRRKFSEKHGIPQGTIQNWEDARYYRGLGDRGAKRAIKALANEDVDCRIEWLLYGVGEPPLLLAQTSAAEESTSRITDYQPTSAQQAIAQELLLFHKLNQDAIDMIVVDNAMLPAYRLGDLVAGKRYFGKAITKAINQDCIVQLMSGEQLIRQLQPGRDKDHYQLRHYSTSVNTKAHNNVEIFSAAPILWIRRPA